MASSNSLILLVHSLTKSEKRYFTIYSSMQKGAKDYMRLFELLEKNTDPRTVKKLFAKARPAASYESTSKYLYKVITDCLIHVRANQDKTTRLAMSLLKANVLFEKSMPDEGFKELQKVQEAAEKNEEYFILMWACRFEMYYLANLNFNNISEKNLVHKQMRMDELLKYSKNIHQHTSLYELLRHRLLFKGAARTRKQKEDLNDLVFSELNIVAKAAAETVESQKTHLLFQSHYFISISDYRSALKAFYELIDLLDENEYLWNDAEMDYLSTVEGILESLRMIRKYEEMDFFLEKLDNLLGRSVYLDVMVYRVGFIYRLSRLLDQGEFEEAVLLKDEYHDVLFKKIHLLDLNKQAELYLYTSLIYMSAGNINRAHHFLSKVLLESKLFHALPVYRTFRLLHLLVHYELGNDEFIAYETRSFKRGLNASHSKTYLLEKLVLRFVQEKRVKRRSSVDGGVWKKVRKEFDTIRNDKYEIQILKIFDFESWIEAKLTNRPFKLIVREKFMQRREADSEKIPARLAR